MKKAELMELVGKTVTVTFSDGQTSTGELGYTTKFCEELDYRRVGFFTVNNWDFRVSHIKKCVVNE